MSVESPDSTPMYTSPTRNRVTAPTHRVCEPRRSRRARRAAAPGSRPARAPRPSRKASGARHSAPATAPIPWAVVSSAVVCATARAPPPCVRCRAITGTSAMNGEARKATTAIVPIAARQDGSARAAVKPGAQRRQQAGPAGRSAAASRTKASATTTARNDAALARNATAVAERRHGGAGQRRAGDPAQVELGRVQRDGGQELRPAAPGRAGSPAGTGRSARTPRPAR